MGTGVVGVRVEELLFGKKSCKNWVVLDI